MGKRKARLSVEDLSTLTGRTVERIYVQDDPHAVVLVMSDEMWPTVLIRDAEVQMADPRDLPRLERVLALGQKEAAQQQAQRARAERERQRQIEMVVSTQEVPPEQVRGPGDYPEGTVARISYWIRSRPVDGVLARRGRDGWEVTDVTGAPSVVCVGQVFGVEPVHHPEDYVLNGYERVTLARIVQGLERLAIKARGRGGPEATDLVTIIANLRGVTDKVT